MSRITASKKQLKGDPVYNDLLVSKFTNCLMWDGKKNAARKIVYDALDILAKKVPDVSPLEVFTTALENV
ncbi:MAG: 30S ribosomal protein S7, partial [Thermoguttaceae bacterium]|nr:30S ribosomal protein S7 [Thermoguttaceae bacterium]